MGTKLTPASAWSDVISPNPGEPVRAGGGTGTPISIGGDAGSVNGDLTYTGLVAGVRVRHLGGTSKTLGVTVTGTDVDVQLETDGGGASTGTATATRTAVLTAAAALVTVTAGGTGAGAPGIEAWWHSIANGILGSIRTGLQALANRIRYMLSGARSFASLTVDGTGDLTVAPTAGRITASEDVRATRDVLATRHIRATQDLSALGSLVIGTTGQITGDLTVGADIDALTGRVSSVDHLASAGADVALLSGPKLAFSSLTTAGDPGSSTGITNALLAPLIPKAWLRFTTDGAGALTVLDGSNITSAACVAGTGFVLVVIADNMKDVNYAVVANAADASGVPQNPAMYPTVGSNATYRPNTTQFYLLFPGGFRPDTTVVDCALHVFGRQTS